MNKVKRILNFCVAGTFLLMMAVFLRGKVFSSSPEKNSVKNNSRLEEALLLTNTPASLPENEAKKIIAKLSQPIVKEHTVGRNEWLEKIARDFGVPAISIRSTNNLEDPLLRPGQKILAQNKPGIFHLAKKGETLEGLLATYEKLGAKKAKIMSANDLVAITLIEDGQFYLKEGEKIWIPEIHRRYPYLSRPVAFRKRSSYFGLRRHPILKIKKFHTGDDLVAPYGAPVYAGESGTVLYAGWMDGYGNVVDIKHGRLMTRYGHLSKIYVQDGQRVKRKQLIGRVGSTGLSTGPHLHFEVFKDGRRVPPRRYY